MNKIRRPVATGESPTTQAERFVQAARELGADEDEKAWEERLRKVAGQKPAPEKPE